MTISTTTLVLAALLAATASAVGASASARVPGSPFPLSSAGANCSTTLHLLSTRSWSPDDTLTAQTLAGVTAQTCPTVYRDHGGSYTTWMNDLKTKYGVTFDSTFATDPAGLVKHYASDLKGYILCTLGDASTNAAITLAGALRAIAVTSTNEAVATGAGLTMLHDARQMTQLQALSLVGDKLSTSVSVVQEYTSPSYLFLADYSTFARAFSWYDASPTGALASAAFSHQQPASSVVGWGPDEQNTVATLSKYGLGLNAANWAVNMGTLSNFEVGNGLKQKAAPTVTKQKASPANVHTVTFVMTDGDNVQWVLDGFEQPKWYGSSSRGEVNLGWTLSLALSELAPTVVQHLYETEMSSSKGRDYFIGGVSGLGYMYTDLFDPSNSSAHTAFADVTAALMEKADMSILNVLADNADIASVDSLTAQDAIDAIVMYLYSDYSGLHGAIDWSNGKPVIGGRWNLWTPGFENVTSLAAKLNNMPRDPGSSDGYSLIPVHVWSQNVTAVVEVQKLLDEGVEVVTPDVFVARVVENLKPTTASR